MYKKIKNIFWRQPRWIQVLILKTAKPKMVDSLLSLRSKNGKEKIIKKFEENKCIFVHIPKTGGKSIKKSLFETCSGGHRKLRIYRILFDKNEFSKYFKFAFVRNPWDRVVSAYEFLRNGGIRESDQEWSKKVLSNYESFNDFIENWMSKSNIYDEIHFVPQYEFICLGGTNPRVDYIGKFENFKNDFDIVCEEIGVNSELIHDNRSKRRKDYKDYYNEKTKKKVGEVYNEDIKIFDYEF